VGLSTTLPPGGGKKLNDFKQVYIIVIIYHSLVGEGRSGAHQPLPGPRGEGPGFGLEIFMETFP